VTARTAALSGRRFAEEQMVDEGTITRDGASVLNPTTGLREPTAASTVYAGKCRLRTPTAQELEVLFGEQQVTLSRYMLDVPHTTRGVRVDDVVTMTLTEDSDAEVLPLRIVAVTAETIFGMKSYPCEAAA
jgi:hypothetical protein